MYCSSIASRNGRLLVRLSILSTDRMAILFLSLNASVPTKSSGFSTFTFNRLLGQLSESSLSKHLTCVSRTYSQLQPTNLTYFSLLISRQVVGVLTCPNTSLVPPGPTSNFNLPILPISLYLSPGKLSEFSLVQTPHLCLQDSLPTSACRDILNAHLQASCRSFHLSKHLTCVSRTYSQLQPVEIFSSISQKHVVSGNQLTSHFHQMTLQPTCQKKK